MPFLESIDWLQWNNIFTSIEISISWKSNHFSMYKYIYFLLPSLQLYLGILHIRIFHRKSRWYVLSVDVLHMENGQPLMKPCLFALGDSILFKYIYYYIIICIIIIVVIRLIYKLMYLWCLFPANTFINIYWILAWFIYSADFFATMIHIFIFIFILVIWLLMYGWIDRYNIYVINKC